MKGNSGPASGSLPRDCSWVGLPTVAALLTVPKIWLFTEPRENLAAVESMPQPWTDIVTSLAPCFLAAGLTVLAVTPLSSTLRTALVGNPQAWPADVEH